MERRTIDSGKRFREKHKSPLRWLRESPSFPFYFLCVCCTPLSSCVNYTACIIYTLLWVEPSFVFFSLTSVFCGVCCTWHFIYDGGCLSVDSRCLRAAGPQFTVRTFSSLSICQPQNVLCFPFRCQMCVCVIFLDLQLTVVHSIHVQPCVRLFSATSHSVTVYIHINSVVEPCCSPVSSSYVRVGKHLFYTTIWVTQWEHTDASI